MHPRRILLNYRVDTHYVVPRGAVGYSLAQDGRHFQGMELRFRDWSMRPLHIRQAQVQLFDDGKTFPPGTTQVDSAMITQRLRHEWHVMPDLDGA